MIIQVAKSVASRYSRYLEIEEVEQELWAWCLSNAETVERYLGDGEIGHRKLNAALRNAATNYCEKERKYQQSFEEPIPYTPDMIRRLLGEIAWDETSNVAVLPVAIALEKLSQEDLHVLRLFHTEGLSAEDVADQLGISEDAAKMRESRAVDRVLNRLHVPRHEGPGARQAMSNSTALAITADQDH